MISKISFSMPCYTPNRVGFKASPKEIAEKVMKVDPQEPDDVEEFADEIDKEPPEKLRQAAQEVREKQPNHWAAGWLDKMAALDE